MTQRRGQVQELPLPLKLALLRWLVRLTMGPPHKFPLRLALLRWLVRLTMEPPHMYMAKVALKTTVLTPSGSAKVTRC